MSNGQEPSRPRLPMVPGPAGTHVVHGPDGTQLSRPPARQLPGPVGHVAGAIAKVMAEVGTIRKGGHNDYFNYDYARMEDLLQAVTPLMGKHGLAVIQNEIDVKTIENRVAVVYEFVVMHESNQQLPPQRFTGVSLARDRKGNWDDKAINKCHTAARKYFLLSLFQVPAGDFDDGDEDKDANQRRAVPGPGAVKKPVEKAASAPAQQKSQDDDRIPLEDKTVPHILTVPEGTTADQWASFYIKAIGTATTAEQIAEWDKLNDGFLQRLSDRYSAVYEMINTAVQRRLSDVQQTRSGMPDPKADSQEAMNWIAGQLQQLNTYEAAEMFWNTVVAPRESEFDQLDWEMLMGEWQRAEARLAKDTGTAGLVL